MKSEIICNNCQTKNIVIDNTLFFSEKKKKNTVYCSICRQEIATFETDGWFFVQSAEQYELDKKIEIQKEKLKCTDINY